MDNRDKASSSSWLALFRRKVSNKFKRNRQKIEESDEIEENEVLEISSSINSITSLSAQSCEEVKQELLKLNWYWPNLSRLDAQKLLSNMNNGSFLYVILVSDFIN